MNRSIVLINNGMELLGDDHRQEIGPSFMRWAGRHVHLWITCCPGSFLLLSCPS